MIETTDIVTLLLNYNFWYILGIILIACEILIGSPYFFLSFGLSGLVTGVFIHTNMVESITSSWYLTILFFSIVSVVFVFILQWWFQGKKPEKDINDY